MADTPARPATLYIYDAREPLWLSGARDALTFGGLIGTAVALNTLIPPSGWLNAALAICWILWLAGKGAVRRSRMTPAEARSWIDREFPDPSPA